MKDKIARFAEAVTARINSLRKGGEPGEEGPRRLRPLVVLPVMLAVLAGLTFARASVDGQTTVEAEPSPTASPDPWASPSGVAPPDGSGGGGSVNNEVVIRNITDGRLAHRAGVGLARVTGGEVSNTNSAAAVSACTDCRTVAVAVQAVLVMGQNSSASPKNQAVAINSNCTRCESFALAYQYVVSTKGIVHFTSEGQQRLSALEAEIRELTGSRLGFLELESQVDAVVEKIWGVVRSETVKAGFQAEGKVAKDRDEAPMTDASPSPSDSASPSESPSGSPSESPVAEPSSTGSQSPSPSVSSSESPPSSSSIGG